ncbi:MAG: hypothetical protein U5K00_06570 [Melioribacteraceae bacterium]|nr:hypothetical protein [Melioribacteraceae bacterium]
MDVINLLVGINLFLTLTANASGAKKGLKSTVSEVVERPRTYLQKWPLNVAAIVLILEIFGVFKLGVFEVGEQSEFYIYRLIGLGLFLIFPGFKYGRTKQWEKIILKK